MKFLPPGTLFLYCFSNPPSPGVKWSHWFFVGVELWTQVFSWVKLLIPIISVLVVYLYVYAFDNSWGSCKSSLIHRSRSMKSSSLASPIVSCRGPVVAALRRSTRRGTARSATGHATAATPHITTGDATFTICEKIYHVHFIGHTANRLFAVCLECSTQQIYRHTTNMMFAVCQVFSTRQTNGHTA